MLENGRYASVSDVARAEKVDRSYAGSILRQTLRAPDIVEAILHGQVGHAVTLPRLIEPWPTTWEDQKTTLEAE
jgi:hypothetical protein